MTALATTTITFTAPRIPTPWAADADDDLAHARFYRLVRSRWALTPQDVAMCYHLLRGVTLDKEIATTMRLGLTTVKGHMARIRARLGVASREQVVLALWPLYRRARAAAGGGPCSTG